MTAGVSTYADFDPGISLSPTYSLDGDGYRLFETANSLFGTAYTNNTAMQQDVGIINPGTM